jgi:2-polyprenyl-3-methyl-5-hydroxy-6-metoxy-1,4-benzoquinol methylase
MTALRVRYQTYEFDDIDIHIRSLRSKQEFVDTFGVAEVMGISSAQWSLFGVVWDSSKMLANEMKDFDFKGKRILEVGCGLALSSLLLNHRNADVTATDYHPEAAGFLTENTRLNQVKAIPFLQANWLDEYDALGKFDVVIGSDVLYERQHVAQLSQFIERHANPNCEVILVDPGRKSHAAFSKHMVALDYIHTQRRLEVDKFKGWVLNYRRSAAAHA